MPLNTIIKFLSTTEPFSRLPPQERVRLSAASQEVKFKKGDQIYFEGKKADCINLLESGRVEIFKNSLNGRISAIESIKPGLFFGVLCRLGSGNKTSYPCTAVASVDSTVIRIPDSLFFDFFHRYPAFSVGIGIKCSEKLHMMQDLAATSKEPVDIRIIKTLEKLSLVHGNVLPFTKREIAAFSTTTVETAIRTLSSFQKKDWISSSRGQIVIKNLPRAETHVRARSAK